MLSDRCRTCTSQARELPLPGRLAGVGAVSLPRQDARRCPSAAAGLACWCFLDAHSLRACESDPVRSLRAWPGAPSSHARTLAAGWGVVEVRQLHWRPLFHRWAIYCRPKTESNARRQGSPRQPTDQDGQSASPLGGTARQCSDEVWPCPGCARVVSSGTTASACGGTPST